MAQPESPLVVSLAVVMSVGTHCVTGRLREFGTRVLFSGPPKRGSFDNSTGYWNYMPPSLMYQSDFSNSGSFSSRGKKGSHLVASGRCVTSNPV